VIQGRNIFDSSNAVIEEIPTEPAVSAAGPSDEAEGCTLPVTVVATLPVLNRRGEATERSMATLEVKEENPPLVDVFSIGQEVAAGAFLVWVDREGVELEQGGKRQRCSLDTEGITAARPPVAAVSRTRSSPSGEGIRRVGSNTFEIDQSEVDSALNNLSSLATEARIVPYFENGQSKGFKLYSIKPNSLIAKIGIMNGDVIQKVNGYDINSPEKALQIYSMLKNENNISIDVMRNGQPKSFQYRIK
jgi:general secretion pathway protein C